MIEKKVKAQLEKDKKLFKAYLQTKTPYELKTQTTENLFSQFLANKLTIQTVLIDELIEEVKQLKKQVANITNASIRDILDVNVLDELLK